MIDRLHLRGRDSLGPIGKSYWPLVVPAIYWGMWTERNRTHFEGKERNLDRMICDIKELICYWGLSELGGRGVSLDEVTCDWQRVMYDVV
ncbi:hypothetical protein ACHQM5_019489 [Ranunculus cassubicifolius]